MSNNINFGYRRNFGAYDAVTRMAEAWHESNMQKRALKAQSKERSLDRMAQQQCASLAADAAIESAKMQRDARIEEARSNERIAAMKYDAELRMAQDQNAAEIKKAEYHYLAERDRGLGTLELQYKTEDRRKREAEEELRQGGVVRDFNGDRISGVYNGDYLRSVPHGHGDFYYDDNRRYIGDFAAGRFDGVGDWYDINGILTYSGQWAGGRFNGEGRLRINDNKCFVGKFRGGKLYIGIYDEDFNAPMPGDDAFYVAFRLIDDFAPERGEYNYEGGMSRNRPHGRGRKTYANGDYEEADYVLGKAEGILVRCYNGNIYAGEAKDDMPHGHGQLTLADGATYDGEFEHGRVTGDNLMILKDGTEIEGRWSQEGDTYIVEGTAKCPDGRVLTGTFRIKTGKMTGSGTCIYPNGYLYNGTFSDYKADCGEATQVFGNGISVKIQVENGRVKRNVTTYPDGTTYTGSWKNGQWATGVLRFTDGSYYMGGFSNFKRQGRGTMVYPDGTQREGEWHNDKFVG